MGFDWQEGNKNILVAVKEVSLYIKGNYERLAWDVMVEDEAGQIV